MRKQNSRYVSFSLRFLFIATAIVAFLLYRVIPFRTSIYCDRISNGIPSQVDILGRDETQPFRTVLENVQIISSERSPDFKRGSLRIEIRTSIFNRQKLDKYEILCIREAD